MKEHSFCDTTRTGKNENTNFKKYRENRERKQNGNNGVLSSQGIKGLFRDGVQVGLHHYSGRNIRPALYFGMEQIGLHYF